MSVRRFARRWISHYGMKCAANFRFVIFGQSHAQLSIHICARTLCLQPARNPVFGTLPQGNDFALGAKSRTLDPARPIPSDELPEANLQVAKLRGHAFIAPKTATCGCAVQHRAARRGGDDLFKTAVHGGDSILDERDAADQHKGEGEGQTQEIWKDKYKGATEPVDVCCG